MTLFQKILYLIWLIFPTFFVLMALWSKLEKIGGKQQQENPKDFLRQGGFVMLCVLIAMAIDRFVLPRLVNNFSPSQIPLTFYELLLLPVVFWVASKVIGPSVDIKISKPPDLSRKRR